MDINERLSEIAKGSSEILKKYVDSLPDMQGFVSKDDDTIKRITGEYYLCASALTKGLDKIGGLADEVSSLIKDATAKADEAALADALEIFERIMELTRAHECFFQASESIVSGKKQDFSYAALHRSALVLYTKLASF